MPNAAYARCMTPVYSPTTTVWQRVVGEPPALTNRRHPLGRRRALAPVGAALRADACAAAARRKHEQPHAARTKVGERGRPGGLGARRRPLATALHGRRPPRRRVAARRACHRLRELVGFVCRHVRAGRALAARRQPQRAYGRPPHTPPAAPRERLRGRGGVVVRVSCGGGGALAAAPTGRAASAARRAHRFMDRIAARTSCSKPLPRQSLPAMRARLSTTESVVSGDSADAGYDGRRGGHLPTTSQLEHELQPAGPPGLFVVSVVCHC